MHPATDPPPADASPPLTRAAIQKIVLYFAGHMPAPIRDTADERARRDNDALADVAALEPADDAEVTQAMRCVAAGAWADDQLRLARLYGEDFVRSQQIVKMYALMQRTSDGARATLLRVQTARQRREKAAAGRGRDTGLSPGMLAEMIETREELAGEIEAIEVSEASARLAVQAAEAEAKAAAAEAKAGAARAVQSPALQMAPLEEAPPPTEEEKWLIAADRFATIFPMRTRLIRRFGKLPDDCGIEQPEPAELLEAIRVGDRYSLRWADELTKAEAYVNAGKDRHLCKYEEVDGVAAVDPDAAGSG